MPNTDYTDYTDYRVVYVISEVNVSVGCPQLSSIASKWEPVKTATLQNGHNQKGHTEWDHYQNGHTALVKRAT